MMNKTLFTFFAFLAIPWMGFAEETTDEGLPLFYWHEDKFMNFGDYLSRVLVERIVNGPIRCFVKKSKDQPRKLLAIGSILYFANDGDILWGTGVNGKTMDRNQYDFDSLSVRAVRGPITAQFLKDNFQIDCPEVYGDPGLLFPYFFPEFKKKENPTREYIIVPHYTDSQAFPRSEYENVVYTHEPWYEIIEQILDSKFVIATSLHAIVIAEAYGIPARLLRVSDSRHNHLLKYHDYYQGTGRPNFRIATSVEEALRMRGEPPFRCDLNKLYNAFPFEFWPNAQFQHPVFNEN